MAKRNSAPNRLVALLFIGVGLVIIIGILIWQSLANQLPTRSLIARWEPGRAAYHLTSLEYPAGQRGGCQRPPWTPRRPFSSTCATPMFTRPVIFAGALNIPLGDIETRYRELNPNQWIITYCT